MLRTLLLYRRSDGSPAEVPVTADTVARANEQIARAVRKARQEGAIEMALRFEDHAVGVVDIYRPRP
jgi:hypothetical protein